MHLCNGECSQKSLMSHSWWHHGFYLHSSFQPACPDTWRPGPRGPSSARSSLEMHTSLHQWSIFFQLATQEFLGNCKKARIAETTSLLVPRRHNLRKELQQLGNGDQVHGVIKTSRVWNQDRWSRGYRLPRSFGPAATLHSMHNSNQYGSASSVSDSGRSKEELDSDETVFTGTGLTVTYKVRDSGRTRLSILRLQVLKGWPCLTYMNVCMFVYIPSLPAKNLQSCLQDLKYIVRNQANQKQTISLLKGVTGILHSGLMSALVGLSCECSHSICINIDLHSLEEQTSSRIIAFTATVARLNA